MVDQGNTSWPFEPLFFGLTQTMKKAVLDVYAWYHSCTCLHEVSKFATYYFNACLLYTSDAADE